MTIEDINMNQLKESLESFLNLEYLGVHIEDVKEQYGKQLYFFSVPESSTLQFKNSEFNERIRDKCGLTNLTKEIITETIIESCRAVFGDEEDEEFYDDVRNNISEYVSFFVKVRHGEVWNAEMAKDAQKKIIDDLMHHTYKQV